MKLKPWMAALLVLVTVSMLAKEAFALLVPFSKERIAAAGKHCVHGYDGNLGQVGMYFAGDASAFNEAIRLKAPSEIEEALRPAYASKKVVLHPGPMVVPDYVAGRDDLATDWLVTTWHEDQSGRLEWHLQIDIWLGGQIKLDELHIPVDFAVESGREIEDFVERRKFKEEAR